MLLVVKNEEIRYVLENREKERKELDKERMKESNRERKNESKKKRQ